MGFRLAKKALKDEMSPNELRMFKDLGWEYVFDADINIMSLYQMATEKEFIENKDSCAISSLRRAMKHFKKGKYRGNQEFEELIAYRPATEGVERMSKYNPRAVEAMEKYNKLLEEIFKKYAS